MYRRFSIVILVAGLLMALMWSTVSAQSQSAPPKPESITYLNMGALSGDPGIARAIKSWEESTGIKVNVIEMAYPPVYDKTVTVLSTGDPSIDVLAGSDWWTQDFAAAGWLEPLMHPAISEAISKYPADIQASAMYEGKIYGAPGGNMLQVFYYRTDLMAAAGLDGAPKTWEEVVEVGKKLTIDKDGNGAIDQWGIVFPGVGEWELGHLFQSLVHQAGGQLIDSKTQDVTLNGPEGVRALKLISDLRNTYKIAPPGVNTYGSGDVLMAFKSGNAAMAIANTFMIKELDVEDSAVRGKWAVASLPVFSGGRPSAAYITTPLTLNAASKNKYWAMDFIAHYASIEGQIEEMIYEPGNVALMPDAYDHPLVQNPPADALKEFGLSLEKWREVMAVLKQTSEVVEVEHYRNQEQIDRIWWTAVNSALTGTTSVEDALNHAAATITTLVKTWGR